MINPTHLIRRPQSTNLGSHNFDPNLDPYPHPAYITHPSDSPSTHNLLLTSFPDHNIFSCSIFCCTGRLSRIGQSTGYPRCWKGRPSWLRRTCGARCSKTRCILRRKPSTSSTSRRPLKSPASSRRNSTCPTDRGGSVSSGQTLGRS